MMSQSLEVGRPEREAARMAARSAEGTGLIASWGPGRACTTTGVPDFALRSPLSMRVSRPALVLSLSFVGGCAAAGSWTGPIAVAAPRELEPAAADEPLVEPTVSDGVDRSGGAMNTEAQKMRRQCRELSAPAGPSCEGFDDTRLECEALPDVLETKAAKAAIRCLTARSRTPRICQYNVMEECFSTAYRTARPSSASRRACAGVMQTCAGRPRTDLSSSNCQRAINAVREDRHADFKACMEESCGVRQCVWALVRR